MIRDRWNSLTGPQRAAVAGIAFVTTLAACLWGLGSALAYQASRVTSPQPAGRSITTAPVKAPPTTPALPGPASQPGQPGRHGQPGNPASSAEPPTSVPAAGPTVTPASSGPAMPADRPGTPGSRTGPAVPSPSPATSEPVPPPTCTTMLVSAGRQLLVRDGQILRLTLASRPSGPALEYSGHPPALHEDDRAGAFHSAFAVLGPRFSVRTPPERLPLPGQRQAFVPALTGAALAAGSVAEIYATATNRSQPDYLAVIEIAQTYPDDSMSVDYVTYLRSCRGR